MPETRAADLPPGSVVATQIRVWLKMEPAFGGWQETYSGRPRRDQDVDEALRFGAEVLRFGYGNE